MSGPTSQPKKTIRELREAQGWTQEELAGRLGVTRGAVSTWERGYWMPRPVTQQHLADLLGIGVGEIAFGQDGGAMSGPTPWSHAIRRLRQARGWSQPDLATRVGVVPRTISTWERGVRVPSEVYRQRLAQVFGVSVARITFGQMEEQP